MRIDLWQILYILRASAVKNPSRPKDFLRFIIRDFKCVGPVLSLDRESAPLESGHGHPRSTTQDLPKRRHSFEAFKVYDRDALRSLIFVARLAGDQSTRGHIFTLQAYVVLGPCWPARRGGRRGGCGGLLVLEGSRGRRSDLTPAADAACNPVGRRSPERPVMRLISCRSRGHEVIRPPAVPSEVESPAHGATCNVEQRPK